MVFSSLIFLLVFLPASVLGYHFLSSRNYGRAAFCFLFFASLFYYAYWKPENVLLILVSIVVNYALGIGLSVFQVKRRMLFLLGLCFNLGLLGYFKYTDFLLDSINTAFHATLPLPDITLPIGISFFTFQQIGFLADIYKRKHDPSGQGLLSYCLFVCFFPQLVAGPIVHHREMMPQFASPDNARVRWNNIYAGLTMLSLGLAKKVLIADSLSPLVGYCFDTVASMTFLEAVTATLAYTLQLYFDFSGYSDMAIGCALFFNIHLPQNFLSPYKASNIQDFWRRWHISLSRWLAEYLYIPLGGNRLGTARTCANLLVTFLLGGLWHGAAWTFVLWGAVHGAMLCLHRLWSTACCWEMPRVFARGLTFMSVSLAWIIFRVTDLSRLGVFWDALTGVNGFRTTRLFRSDIRELTLWNITNFSGVCIFLGLVLCMALFLRNSDEIFSNLSVSWRNTLFTISLLLISLLVLSLPQFSSEFIYFQF